MIGSHLLYDLVKKGMSVKALCRKESDRREVKKTFSYYSDNSDELFSKIDWVEGDLLDVVSLADAMEGVSMVYHCAAVISMNRKDGKKMIENNVTGTANVVNMAMEKKIHKLCHVSSVAALGIINGKEIAEDTTWNDESNGSAYAISKYLSENEVWRASQEGLKAVIVNPTIVIGPGNWNRSSGIIFKAAQKGLRWYLPGSMDFVDVRDVVKAMTLLMESEIQNERFIISSENLSFRKFMELLYSSLGKPMPNKKAGKMILEFARVMDGFWSLLMRASPVITKELVRYAAIDLAYSNHKIQNTMDVRFIPVAESVKEVAGHFMRDLKKEK